jgi:hypothetical protein
MIAAHSVPPLRLLSVNRLNRSLELEPADAAALRRLGEMAFRLFD